MLANQRSSSLFNRGMLATLLAQFFSAFGDNALLFAVLAFIKELHYADWSKPLLQMVFVIAFMATAPFVGQIADRYPKGRVMMASNILKLLGTGFICIGLDPFIGYTLVGLGAAAYSPAKFGILGELTTGDNLIKANGLIEVTTIAAILLGSVAGGYVADLDVLWSLAMCIFLFAIAAIANLYIPRLVPARNYLHWSFTSLLRDFFKSTYKLLGSTNARFTLLGTCLFWGSGMVLRFLLIDWVPAILHITDNKTPTLLNALAAFGIVIGAGLAARFISMRHIERCIPAGIAMGLVVVVFSLQSHMVSTSLLLIVIGILGGFFLVPLNALLQYIGRRTIGAGRAVAVQNFGENGSMLVMLGLYSLTISLGLPVIVIGIGFGLFLSLVITLLWCWKRKNTRKV